MKQETINLALKLKGLYPFTEINCHEGNDNQSDSICIADRTIFFPHRSHAYFSVFKTTEIDAQKKTDFAILPDTDALCEYIDSIIYKNNEQRIYNILLDNRKGGVQLNLAFIERLYEWSRLMGTDLMENGGEWTNWQLYNELNKNIKKNILLTLNTPNKSI